MMRNEVQFFCPLWGSESLPFTDFLSKIKNAGYTGIEMSLPLDIEKRSEIVSQINSYGLKLIAQHWETSDKDFATHLKNYKMRLKNLAAAHPIFINSQTGKDYFSIEQNSILIAAAADVAAATGITIIHETHRGKFSFAAHVTKKYLDKIHSLQLCLDISHWCCVAESLLEDQTEAVQQAIAHTHHIHARVGFAEGPQVMDPRAPEWNEITEQHIAWWQQIVQRNNAENRPATITTEFGPYPYLQQMPFTMKPIYSQWEANLYMMDLLRIRLM